MIYEFECVNLAAHLKGGVDPYDVLSSSLEAIFRKRAL